MNLLEINATKLMSILNTDVEKGIKSEDVERNRREFCTDKASSSLSESIRGIFGDVMPALFILLSILLFALGSGGRALLALTLFSLIYLLFRVLAKRYSKKVSSLLNSNLSKASVIRDGRETEVEFSALVPGDIMTLKLGDVVPCDALVLWQDALRVSEIQLTGNSTPVIKVTQDSVLSGKGVPYYECILFAGSVVMSGSAKVLVCNLGRDVYDKHNKLTSRSKHAHKTKIYEVSSFISHQVSLVWILATFFMFIWGITKGIGAFETLLLFVTLAVGAMPDLILDFFDLTLSHGTMKLLKKGCVVRDMSVIDRLCDVSCVIVDNSRYFRYSAPKPNTIYVNGEKKKFNNAIDADVRALFELAVMASSRTNDSVLYNGVSIERSLISQGAELGLSQESLSERYLVLERRPYTEINGMSRIIYFMDSEFYVVSIGIPQRVLRTCTFPESEGSSILDARSRRRLIDVANTISSGNEGVLAIATKKVEYREGRGLIDSDSGYTFRGYIGVHTPIKADAASAVNVLQKSGTDVVLMTNEAPYTATSFAKSLSILHDGERTVNQNELSALDEGMFRADIKDYKLFMSILPENKAKIAFFRKAEGDIVAVTSSGVDDLQLVIESDVSFSEAGASDTAVAQNSDIIINGGFELLPECIKYARSIYHNTRQMLQLFVSLQAILLFSSVLPIIFTGAPQFTPLAILVYSALVALPILLALSTRGLTGDEMKNTFGAQNLEINFQNIFLIPIISGFVSGVVITLSGLTSPVASSSAGAFITLVSSTVFLSFALSAEDIFETNSFKSPNMLIGTLTSLAITALFVFVPPLASLIGVKAPDFQTTAMSLLVGLIPSLVCVGVKLIKKYVFTVKQN